MKDEEEHAKREKELLNKISELQEEVSQLQLTVKDLEDQVKERDCEIMGMKDRVREAMETMENEKRICKERIQEVESEYIEKERTLHDKLKREMSALIQE